jgi:hypothetical protein
VTLAAGRAPGRAWFQRCHSLALSATCLLIGPNFQFRAASPILNGR